jgi:hypothetical protein
MEYLIKILTAYPRLLITGAFILVPVLSVAAPTYALGSALSFVAVVPQQVTNFECSGGPSFSTVTTSSHTGQGEKCLVQKYIDPIVTVLAGLVGVFVVLSIIIAGIQYSAAGDDSSKVAAAKGRITKALIALLAFLFLLAFVKYLLPNGLKAS